MTWVSLLSATLLLAGCSSGPLSLLTGGGPNVAANVQAGQTNNQTLGTNTTTLNTIKNPTADTIVQDSSSSRVQSESVEKVVVNEGVPWWAVTLVGVACLALGLAARDDVRDWFQGRSGKSQKKTSPLSKPST